MGDSSAKLGPTLGRVHAWRDRGSIYTEGFRTSAQTAILLAGVAKGADFTGVTWALALGLGAFLGLEGLKVGLGLLDYRWGIMREHQRMAAEQNPVTMRMVAALEKVG